MLSSRRRLLAGTAGWLALPAVLPIVHPASAQEPAYPNRAVRMVVPFAPGGAGDIMARQVSAKFQQEAGQVLVIENKPGAGGMIATDYVARAQPNGYTLLLGSSAQLALDPVLYEKVPYDPVRDFAPVALLGATTNVIVVHPSRPEHTLADLIATAKAHPGELSFGSSGAGSTPHLAAELLKLETGIQMTHIPFNGGGPALTAALSNQVPVSFIAISSLMPSLKAGKLRALAVTGPARAPLLPGVPTVAETLPGFDAVGWYGVLAPAGTSAEVVERLHAVMARITAMPDVRAIWETEGIDVRKGSAADFGAYIKSELRKSGDVAKRSGIKVEQ